jgi:hypothetical protein
LFWNEGRAVKRDRALNEGAGLVASVEATKVVPGNNGKLIHITGPAIVLDTIRDDEFKLSAKAVRIERKVETLQWSEKTESKTRNKLGGGTETVTTYKYELKWSDRPIDSASFRHPQGHENRPTLALKSKTTQAKNVKVGAFSLNPSQISRIGENENYALTRENLPTNLPETAEIGFIDGTMFVGSATHDRAGDVRISVQIAKPTTVSIVSGQNGTSFSPYKTSNGGTISLLARGARPAAQMFETAVAANNTMTWILRAVGLVMLFIGFKMVFAVLAVIGSVIPLLGSIVGAGVTLIAFLLAICIGFIVIAIAWVFYRPIIGLALLAIGIAAGVAAVMRSRKLSSAPAPAE